MHVQKNNICMSTQVGVYLLISREQNDKKNYHTPLESPCDTTEACSSPVLPPQG